MSIHLLVYELEGCSVLESGAGKSVFPLEECVYNAITQMSDHYFNHQLQRLWWYRAYWHICTRCGIHSCPNQQPPGEHAFPRCWHSLWGDSTRPPIPDPRLSTPWLWEPPHCTLFPHSFIPDSKARSCFNTGSTGSHRVWLLWHGGWLYKVIRLFVINTCEFSCVFQLRIYSILCIPSLYPTQITI